MSSPYITKSDFKACLDCRTKLYYRKNRYPSNLDNNEYLQFLADGGFMVEFLAKAQFPGGIDLTAERDPAGAFDQTKALLSAGDVTLFEGAALAGKYHVRTDILKRTGDMLQLIEIKSSSLGDDNDPLTPFLTAKGAIHSQWRETLLDVAFQTHVLRLAFPQFRVEPVLCLLDKTATATTAETLDRFTLTKDPSNPRARPRINYRGDVATLRGSKLVCFRPVETEVNMLMPEVARRAEALADLLTSSGVTRVQEDIADRYRQCRTCEYRIAGEIKDGFRACWGKLAEASPHILDLYRVGQITTREPDPVPALLRRGSASMLDLTEGELGAPGTLRERRFMQWHAMRAGGVEKLPAELKSELSGHQIEPGWPLHFVDFEACDIALPHHAGLHPYERVAFQWSCHSIGHDGKLTHAEWLNSGREFPNFAFARTLRERLGDHGTVYVWSPYEQATLKRVLQQLTEWISRDIAEAARLAGLPNKAAVEELADWIERLLGPEDEKGGRHSSRIKDLHDLARRYYFHPHMGGRTSIKVVLPAVWESDERLWRVPEFREYYREDEHGKPMDPYKVLPAIPLDGDAASEDAVREGTGAIRVYQDMIFSRTTTPELLAARRQLLLQYCRLDTAAMVMIWMRWMDFVP